MELLVLIQQFEIQGEPKSYKEIGGGLINKTYKVSTSKATYTLQKVNKSVFNDPEHLGQNILLVSDYLDNTGTNSNGYISLKPILTRTHTTSYKDENNDHWRVFDFIPGNTLDKPENEKMLEELGLIFGTFHRTLRNFPIQSIKTLLPDFHNTSKRLEALKLRIVKDPFKRLQHVKGEVECLARLESEMMSKVGISVHNDLSLRIVHQDAKLSNVIFDNNGKAKAIIDLDTIGAGYLAYDFGDIVRSTMNTSIEDEDNIKAINLRLDYFQTFVKAYASESKSFISIEEVKSLVPGALTICYEQAIRFLDDYLNGDQYFKIEMEKHNLSRARNQIAYLKVLLKNRNEMHDIVRNAFNNL